MNKRLLLAGLALGAVAALAFGPAAQSADSDTPDRGRVASNGTTATGVRDSHDRYANDDRIANNGTQLTGVRLASLPIR